MSYQGVIKSFNDARGFGFIDLNGGDVFVLVKDCQEGRPQIGDQVTFDVEEDQVRVGQRKAVNVTGCTGSAFKAMEAAAATAINEAAAASSLGVTNDGNGGGSGKFSGYVTSFNDAKGWGFIDMDGTDVFLRAKDCVSGRPVVGDYLHFNVEEAAFRAGQKKALNVTGCTGTDAARNAANKGWSGYGPTWSAGGWDGWGWGPCGGYGADWYGKGGKSGYGYGGDWYGKGGKSGYGYGGCGYNVGPYGGGKGYGKFMVGKTLTQQAAATATQDGYLR